MKIAICPGTFDPVTLGHVDIIERGLKVFDRIIVGVTAGSSKPVLFSVEERVRFLREVFHNRKDVEIKAFEGLLVDFARKEGVHAVLRGLRTVSDFEYEVQMAAANRFMSPQLETFFVMTDGRYSHLSSSLIREILRFGGKVTGMVPPQLETLLQVKK